MSMYNIRKRDLAGRIIKKLSFRYSEFNKLFGKYDFGAIEEIKDAIVEAIDEFENKEK